VALALAEALKHLATFPPSGNALGAALLVTGSPGISKSYSFIPALRLVRGLAQGRGGPLPPAIIIEDRAMQTVVKLRLDGRGAVTSAHRISLEDFRPRPTPTLTSTPPCTSWTPPALAPTAWESPPVVAARTVVVSSPNSKPYKNFEKRRPSPHPLYMSRKRLRLLAPSRCHGV
jgi:hypothetical protein